MTDLNRIASALEAIADAIKDHSQSTAEVAKAINKLGLADAATPMGAIESVGLTLHEQLEAVSHGLHAIADAITEKGSR